MATELTDRESVVLSIIREFCRRHGYPPTIRQLCELVGASSPSTVHQCVVALRRKGYLKNAGRRGSIPVERPKFQHAGKSGAQDQ